MGRDLPKMLKRLDLRKATRRRCAGANLKSNSKKKARRGLILNIDSLVTMFSKLNWLVGNWPWSWSRKGLDSGIFRDPQRQSVQHRMSSL